MTRETGKITLLLAQVRDGDECATARLIEAVYQELRRLAEYYLQRERPEHTLQATELVHEAYIRLVGRDGLEWRDRLHFFSVAAQVMRRLLVDYARARGQLKRGGGNRMPFEEALAVAAVRSDELLAVDEALQRLTLLDPRQGRIVELRYFAGLSIEEVAGVLEISERTVKREWQAAKAWLRAEVMGL